MADTSWLSLSLKGGVWLGSSPARCSRTPRGMLAAAFASVGEPSIERAIAFESAAMRRPANAGDGNREPSVQRGAGLFTASLVYGAHSAPIQLGFCPRLWACGRI